MCSSSFKSAMPVSDSFKLINLNHVLIALDLTDTHGVTFPCIADNNFLAFPVQPDYWRLRALLGFQEA